MSTNTSLLLFRSSSSRRHRLPTTLVVAVVGVIVVVFVNGMTMMTSSHLVNAAGAAAAAGGDDESSMSSSTASSKTTETPAEFNLTVVARGNYTSNGVTVSSNGTVFINQPRFPGFEDSFAVGVVDHANGPDDLWAHPFPGGEWNEWREGKDGTNAFVFINAVHIFGDDTLWVVDPGTAPGGTAQPGAQKLVQFNITTRDVIQIIRFNETYWPPGCQINDLRFYDNYRYLVLTDSALGGIILHDFDTNTTMRRLSESPAIYSDGTHPQRGYNGRPLKNETTVGEARSNQLEVDAQGVWLYIGFQVGPVKRVKLADLWNTSIDDDTLASNLVEAYHDAPTFGGSAMDSDNNLYLSDYEARGIWIIAGDNSSTAMLVQSELLNSPDALFIDRHRNLYIPIPQIEDFKDNNGGVDATRRPFVSYSYRLPPSVGSIALGDDPYLEKEQN